MQKHIANLHLTASLVSPFRFSLWFCNGTENLRFKVMESVRQLRLDSRGDVKTATTHNSWQSRQVSEGWL